MPVQHRRPGEELITPGEVADALKVDVKTVGRWAKAGKIRFVTTPGGHRRFFASDLHAILEARS